MVREMLTGNGITRCERGTHPLVGSEELSDAEREQLLTLYRQRSDGSDWLSWEASRATRSHPQPEPRARDWSGPWRTLLRFSAMRSGP
jgi:hypothetical protein